MKQSTFLVLAASAVGGVLAWMPAERNLAAFNRSSGAGGHDRRVPSPPTGKIRGVNLGGWLVS